MRPERNVSVQTRCDRREMRSLPSELLRFRTQWMQVRKTVNQFGIEINVLADLRDLDVITTRIRSLREGNVFGHSFTSVCLFTGVTTNNCTIGYSQALPNQMDLFKLGSMGPSPTPIIYTYT